MPELIDTPVTMADFPEVIPAARSLFLAVVGAGGVEGLVRIEDALQLLEVGDFPDISSLVDDAIAAKADKATPFVNVASAATINLGAAASTSVNITGMTGPVSSFGTTAPEGAEYLLRWNGAVTIANGANLITGTGADLTTYSGMYMLVKKDASNVWRLIWWSRRLLATGGGTSQLTFNLSALSANRAADWPNRNVNIAMGGWVELASVPTASGGAVAINFPTEATEVELVFARVSFSGAGNGLIQMNVGGVAVAAGYEAGSAPLGGNAAVNTGAVTNGFPIYGNAAGNSYNGRIKLKKYVGTNEWVIDGILSLGSGTGVSLYGSSPVLAGAADGLTFTPSTAFDFGKVFLRYR